MFGQLVDNFLLKTFALDVKTVHILLDDIQRTYRIGVEAFDVISEVRRDFEPDDAAKLFKQDRTCPPLSRGRAIACNPTQAVEKQDIDSVFVFDDELSKAINDFG